MSLDVYFNRSYNVNSYNCAHFVCEVWKGLQGEEIAEKLKGFLCARHDRFASVEELRCVRFLGKPVSPCLVLFQASASTTHVGIWYKGKVLDIGPRGVRYMPLEVASLGYKRVRFFKCLSM